MEEVLKWLSPENLSATHQILVRERVDNSGLWFLDSQKFRHWVNGESHQFLFCPGRGKKYLHHTIVFLADLDLLSWCREVDYDV